MMSSRRLRASGALLRRTTNGQAQSYAAAMIGAILLLAVLLVLAENARSARAFLFGQERCQIGLWPEQHT